MTRYLRAYPCGVCNDKVIYDSEANTMKCKCGLTNAPQLPSDLAVMWDRIKEEKKQ